jgi:hypothetical protein
MIFKFRFFLSFILLSGLPGCSFEEPVVFKGVDRVNVVGMKDGFVNIEAIAIFNNPNDISGRLKKVDVAILLRKDTLATITQRENLRIEKLSDFAVPIKARLSIKEIQSGVLNNIFAILGNRKLSLRFVGSIKVSSWGVTRTVPVDFESEVNL